MKKLTMHNAQLTIIIAIILLSLAACTSEELNPSIATSTLLVAPPPAWSNGSGTLPTRATIDLTTLKTKWEDGDQLTLTATYHHKSGYKETETAVTYTRATGAWPEMKITWPIGNITHADVAATITGKDNGTGRPIFYGTATGVKPGQPITITFGPDAHRTAALQFKNLLATDVVNVPALGITNSQERIFYFAPTGSKLTGTAAGENFTIDMGTSPLGKVHYVKAGGHQAGGTTPESIIEAKRFIAWAEAYDPEDESTHNFTLQCNIDLAGMDWKPIGTYTAAYTGTFNGNGYTISGLKISTAYNQGLFGYTVNAVLANVTIKNPVISVTSSSSSNTGTLVGFANTNTTITRCAVEGGKVTGSGRVGGLVGTANGTHIAGCYTAGTQVTGYSAVGGLVGYTNGGTIAACYATATVTANFADGGLVGSNTGSTTIAFCYTTEDKLVGDDSGTTVSCYDGSATPNLTTLQGYATEVPVDIWTASTGKKQIPLTGTIWKTLTTFNLEQLK